MRNLKKLVALIVTLAMVATFAIPAFAATPADVKGTDYEGAVTRLVALGVIAGYPDGNFGPNDSITRAQAAAVLVRALGFEATAEAAKGVTKFSDVAANYWGAGYINLAVSLNLIKGYGDGKFGPEDKVTYEQIVTMIVRALMQEAYAENKGGFPTGYLLQARVIGFTDDVKGASGVDATRGIVAQLVDNAKAKPIYIQTGFGDSPTYGPGDETFLSRLGMELKDANEDVIVTGTPGSTGLDANTMAVGSTTFDVVVGMFDVESLLGKKVDLWTNSDGDVVLAEVVEGTAVVASSIEYDVADAVYTATLPDDTTIDYTVAAGAGAIYNLKSSTVLATLAAVNAVDEDRLQISLVVNDDEEIQFINAVKFGSAIEAGDPVVNTVAKSIKINSYWIKRNDEDIKKLVVEKDGEIADYTAIKDGDILFVAFTEGGTTTECDDDYLYVKATSKTITGTLKAAKPSLTAATSIKVGDTWYDKSEFINTIADTDDYVDTEITVTLDPAGKVFAIDGTTSSSPDKYGVIIGSLYTPANTLEDDVYKVKLLTASGDEITYSVIDEDETLDLRTAIQGTTATGKLIKYFINSDGNLSDVTITGNPVTSTATVIDVDHNKYGGKYVTSDIVVFSKDTDGGYSVVKWAEISDDDTAQAFATVKDDDTGEYVALLLDAPELTTTTDVYAYTTDKTAIADGKFIIDLINESGAASFTTSGTTGPAAGKAIIYTVESDGEITTQSVLEDTAADKGYITDVSSSRIQVDTNGETAGGLEYFYFTDDTVIVYDEDGDGDSDAVPMTKAEIYKDMKVEVYSTDSDINVLVVLEM